MNDLWYGEMNRSNEDIDTLKDELGKYRSKVMELEQSLRTANVMQELLTKRLAEAEAYIEHLRSAPVKVAVRQCLEGLVQDAGAINDTVPLLAKAEAEMLQLMRN